jgi:penicillin-binding protein 1A
MNLMMRDVVAEGTGRRAQIEGQDIAGKTGTSQDYRDAWFIGYSAYLVCGVWVGNDDNSPTQKVTGGSIPAAIWKDIMAPAHQGLAYAALPGAYEEDQVQVAGDGIFDVLRDMFGSSARSEDIEESEDGGVPSFREQLRKARQRR